MQRRTFFGWLFGGIGAAVATPLVGGGFLGADSIHRYFDLGDIRFMRFID